MLGMAVAERTTNIQLLPLHRKRMDRERNALALVDRSRKSGRRRPSGLAQE
jgi:hypothetical protein